jgi:hypothetical protein
VDNTFFAVLGSGSITNTPWTPPATGTLNLDATLVNPGVYQVHVRVSDAAIPTNTTDSLISVVIDDSTILNILNDDQDFQPSSFPVVFSGPSSGIPLLAYGGVPPYTWSLINSATTLPSPSITIAGGQAYLNFTILSYGSFAAGLNVVDAVGSSASTVVLYTLLSSSLFSLVDGQLEVLITVPETQASTRGIVHHFTATVRDSALPQHNATGTFYYTAQEAYSEVLIPEAFFDHYWGNGDTTAVIFPIHGLSNLQGYSLGAPVITQPSNGLTVTIDNLNDVVKVVGPPTIFRSSQIRVPFQVLLGSTQVALISREYTFLAHDGTTDIGAAAMYPRPFIVGDLIGLNPQKPWFNSPSIQKNVNYTARVQAGSSLPPGLSLDANTGLIYGNVQGVGPQSSVIEYVDDQNLVHGTITITWTILSSQYTLINNLTPALVQQPYTGTISSNSTSPLQSVSIVAGLLPTGISVGTDILGQNIVFSGTPLEAGYFDLWLAVTNTSGQVAYIYVRFICDFILPLTILTSSLPNFSNQAYHVELQGFGGVLPYTWSLDANSPALPTGMTLSSSGILSRSAGAFVGPYNQNLIIDLVDSETPHLSTTAVLNLTYDNTLSILTPAIPIAVPGQPYSFAMSAVGGVPPYTWSISPLVNGLTFPTGITFGTNGIFSGVTDEISGSEAVTIQVTDSAATTATHGYTLQIGSASGLVIDTADVGVINRGSPYQGHLSVSGAGTAPYTWQIPPSSPNALPTGLNVTADSGTSGVTATISGTYTGAVLTNYPVEVEVVDANGQTAFAYMLMNTGSNVIITNISLPVGEISGAYSIQLTASGGVPPYTFSLDAHSPALPSGFTLTSGGLLAGTTGSAYNQNIILDVADSLSPANTNAPGQAFNLLIQATNLTITNTSPLPTVTAGVAYTTTLVATESPLNTPFTWSISPSSVAQLPTGITLNSATGVVSGTTQVTGSSSITFRVTDNVGAFSEKTLVLTVNTGLQLRSGIAYSEGINFWTPLTPYVLNVFIIDSNNNIQKVTIAGTSGGSTPAWNTSGTTTDGGVTWTFVGPSYLGYVDNGNVAAMASRPNDSFFVVATGVVSTQPSQIVVTVGSSSVSGISTSVISIVAGVAQIQLTGPFAQGTLGDNSLSLTITDSGVQASAAFKWKVFSSGSLRLAPGSGSFPVIILGA